MTRNRGAINGGYVRKTLSLPRDLVDRIELYLATNEPGSTLSWFMSDAGEAHLERQPKRKVRR